MAGKTCKTVVISFGTEGYKGSLEALRHSALRIGGADECIIFTEKDVADFFAANPEHLRDSRGYGWWAWKPFLIKSVLAQRPDGDVVVYCDSATLFERSLAPYVEAVRGHTPMLLSRLGGWTKADYRNRRWTKKHVFDAMHAGDSIGDEIQINAAFQMYRVCPESKAFVEEYLRWCTALDVVNDDGRDGDCVDTRHDQSILSILAAQHPCIAFSRDVTQYGTKDPPCALAAPAGGAREFDAVDDSGVMFPLVDHHRKLLKIPKIAVITPTIGGKHLRDCIASVQKSTLPNVEHWIVADGEEHRGSVERVLEEFRNKHPIVSVVLPRNVGAGGWCGHRVYGAFPWLVDADYIAFLDDDNAVDPDHYADLVRECISKRVPWAHSLRRIVDESGDAVCDDNCESLGGITHTVAGPGDYLVDTSCYLMQRDLAVEVSTAWNARFRDPERPEADRQVAKTLLSSAPHAVVRKHSVAYRVGSTDRSVVGDFFVRGNAAFGYDFAKFDDLYIFHFSPKATEDFLRTRRLRDRSYALDEWQPTLLRGLDKRYNLINGFANAPNIPHGATVLAVLCNPGEMPLDFFAQRDDLRKIAYTLESPNIRHQGQWNANWLRKHFDVVATYWKPLLDDPNVRTVFAAHNCHHGDLQNELDRKALLRENRGKHRNCVMVLERRPHLFHLRDYAINGVHLKCLDHMREDLVKGLRDVTVFGINWGEIADQKKIKLGHELHRSKDTRSAVDIVQDYDFVIIVENTDAEGYASEKFYDALSAGSIPLYYGSLPFGIPEGPTDGVYIDLRARGITDGEDLQNFIDAMGNDEIGAMKRRIADAREGILRLVDAESFADAIERAVDMTITTEPVA